MWPEKCLRAHRPSIIEQLLQLSASGWKRRGGSDEKLVPELALEDRSGLWEWNMQNPGLGLQTDGSTALLWPHKHALTQAGKQRVNWNVTTTCHKHYILL